MSLPLLQMSDLQDVTNGPGDMIAWHGANTLEGTKPGQYIKKKDQVNVAKTRPRKRDQKNLNIFLDVIEGS